MHPPLSCASLGHVNFHLPDGLHPWEDVYPRREDDRGAAYD